MRFTCHFVLIPMALFFLGCSGMNRTAFSPSSGPPTVGMPAELNDRERLFVGDLESVLRGNGLVPVRHGAGDLALEFTISAGPINTDTRIALLEGERTIAGGNGRASGVPLIGRSSVAEKSFARAFESFQTELDSAHQRRGWSASSTTDQPTTVPDTLPVY